MDTYYIREDNYTEISNHEYYDSDYEYDDEVEVIETKDNKIIETKDNKIIETKDNKII